MAYLESTHSCGDEASKETIDASRSGSKVLPCDEASKETIDASRSGSKVQLTPSGRRVQWQDVAEFEIVEFIRKTSESSLLSNAPEETKESWCWACIEVFLPPGCCNIGGSVGTKTKGKKSQKVPGYVSRLRSCKTPPDAGLLWKLNANEPMTPESFTDLSHWRRRRFALEYLAPGKAQIGYVSEKSDCIEIACDIGRRANLDVELLAPVELGTMDQASVTLLSSSLLQYDVAFRFANKQKNLDFAPKKNADQLPETLQRFKSKRKKDLDFAPKKYENQLPETLHPFKVCADSSHHKGGCMKKIVLGATSPETRDWWLNEIRQMRNKIGCRDHGN